MKIVYISNKPIYPLLDGGCVAMNQFLKCLLEGGFDVKNFTLSTQKHPFVEDKFPEKLASIIRPEQCEIDTRIKPIEALSYLFKKGSYNIDRFINERFKTQLSHYLRTQKVDLIILESVYLAGYITTIRKNCSAKIIIRAHNVEFLIWERLAKNETSLLKRFYFKKLAKDLKKEEIKSLNLVDGIACITKQDQTIFKELGIKTQMTTIPVAIAKKEGNCDYSVSSFYHLGAMNWNPNIEAVRQLVNSIFPKIRTQIPSSKLYLGGSFMPEEFKTDESKGIEVVGFIDDIDNFMTKRGIMLVPLKSGSGVRIKLLEGMSLGVPIVTTEMGAEGIDGQSGTDFMIAKDENAFIQAAIDISNSEEKRASLGRNAKSLVEKNYKIESVTEKLIEFIKYIS